MKATKRECLNILMLSPIYFQLTLPARRNCLNEFYVAMNYMENV